MWEEIYFILKIFNRHTFIYFILSLVVILTFFKIHGSSVGMYNKIFFGDSYTDPNLIAFTPRPIRGDEWIVQTPFAASQNFNNYDHFNNRIHTGEEVATYLDIPNNHWSTFFKPYNWSFFVMDFENAVSFKWWLRGGLLLISCYFLLLFLTKNDYFLSIAGSLILFFSPFVQWWYSVSVLESITYAFFALYAFLRIVNYRSKFDLTIFSLMFTYSSICFLLILYPPFQIPLAWLSIFTALGYLLNNRYLLTKSRLLIIFITLVASITIIGAILLLYYASFQDIIHIIQNTVYPGNRQVIIGGYLLEFLFGGFFNIQLLSTADITPSILGNQSEAANFFLFFPALLPIIFFYAIKQIKFTRRTDFLLLSLSIFLCLMLIWVFFSPGVIIDSLNFSGLIRNILATPIWLLAGLLGLIYKLLFFNLVPHNRLLIGFGLTNLILILYYLSKESQISLKPRLNLGLILALINSLIVFFIGRFFAQNYPNYLPDYNVIVKISLLVLILSLFMLFKYKKSFLVGLLAFSIFSTISVNPVYKGFNPLLHTDLANIIQRSNTETNNQFRWATYDNLLIGNYILANGGNPINGVQLYPDLKLWKDFDPSGKYISIYNRYAHIKLISRNDMDIKFNLNSPDSFTISINPCHPILKKYRVKFFIMQSPINASCLTPVYLIKYPAMPFLVYQREDVN